MGSRRLALVVTAGLAVALSGCSPQPAPEPPSIVIMVPNVKLNFSQEIGAGFEAAAAATGRVQTRVVGPDIVDGPGQVQMFRGVLGQPVDGISLFTLNPDLYAEPLTEVQDRKIPIIAVDNPLPVGSGVSLFIGNDNVELGGLLAEQVIDRLPADATGTVILGTSSPGTPVLDRRADGMRQRFAQLRPKIRVLGPFDSKQEVSANLTAWRTLVEANPDALAFLGTGDADGWNLATIKAETSGHWLAGAFDLDPRALAAVRSGDLLLVSPEHYVKGALAGRLQARAALGEDELPSGWLYVPGLAVTPENVEEISARQASPESRRAALAGQIDPILNDLTAHLRPLDNAG